jgi:proteasome maturation protein
VPATAFPSQQTLLTSAPSAPGVHDTFRANLNLIGPAPSAKSALNPLATPFVPALQSSHPLEARLRGWRATQSTVKMEMLRRTYGIAEPVRRGMELRVAGFGEWRPLALGGGTPLHSDILSGRDWEMDWDDVFAGECSPAA